MGARFCQRSRAAAFGRVATARIGGPVREVVNRSAQYTKELVESVAIRTELGLPPEVPLADERCVVAIRFQQRRDRRMLGRQAKVGRRARRQRLGKADRKSLRVAAGDVCAASGSADRRGGVRAREPQPLPRESVEHRCLIVRPTVATQIAIPEIVREDEQDVGPFRGVTVLDVRRKRRCYCRLDELSARDFARHGRSLRREVRQFVRFAESAPISTSAILFTPLFAVTMLPWAVDSKWRSTPPPDGMAKV